MNDVQSIWDYSQLIEHLAHPYAERPSLEVVLEGTPEQFKHIAQYAAAWGISDDGYRYELIESANETLTKNLSWVNDQYADALLDWLAGPEACATPLSAAYIAFTSLRMAADGF
jgi:hypothetical protein